MFLIGKFLNMWRGASGESSQATHRRKRWVLSSQRAKDEFKGAPRNDIAPVNDFTLEGWQRPLVIRHEMLSEAVCGPETKTALVRDIWKPRGFLRAIDTFDPDRGCRLATHAAHSVLDALRQWNVRHRRRGEVVEAKHAPLRSTFFSVGLRMRMTGERRHIWRYPCR